MRGMPTIAGHGLLMFAVLGAACGQAAMALPAVVPSIPPSPVAVSACGGEGRTSFMTEDPDFDDVQQLFQRVLEANRKEFRGQTGTVRGFGAGSIYPQIWLRDSATLIPATRYFYHREFLTSWLEEHLSHQRANGELWDWIAAGVPSNFVATAPRVTLVFGGSDRSLCADKNTTAADQESSAIDAAWSVFEMTRDREWLRKPIAGRPLLDRLDAALAYVRREHFDEGRGLVTSAFTADWGDVSPAHDDQRAIYVDELTPIVVGLYANVFFARAVEELASMHDAVGDASRADQWRRIGYVVRGAINRQLWQPDRGFYRIHHVVVPLGGAGELDDSNVFAMGGNALAALYDVADETQSALIFGVAAARSEQYGLSSTAGVLLPPYPSGVFAHPILRESFTYQNGGQWDWWGGRLLLAMFRHGYSEAAQAQLVEVGRRVALAGGLYEWYTREGAGQGSATFAGSVGALAGAIYQGLFGLASRADGLDVTVRLGRASGRVRICEPALSRSLVYEYRYDPETRTATLGFEGNAPGPGRLSVRLPERERALTVLVDGTPAAFVEEARGNDRYVAVMTDWTAHHMVIHMK